MILPVLLFVRPAWAITRRWKSAVGLVVGTTSWGQGCLGWPRIWRKSKAKSWADGQEVAIRLIMVDEVASQTEVQYCPKSYSVKLTARWDESYRSYPGRSVRTSHRDNTASDDSLNVQKSAEVIVGQAWCLKDWTVMIQHGQRRSSRRRTCRNSIERASLGQIGWQPKANNKYTACEWW